jgi:predicted ATPase/class 3 adenylate cyclase
VIVVVGAPSGTVTFLFTDIEGSTRLWEAAPKAMRTALARHDEVLRGPIERHGGYVFSTGGDGFGAAFGRAGDALDAAREAMGQLGAETWPDRAPIRVRMGLHTGEAEERDGDYFGPAVNRAARLMAVAHGGQVVCSDVTAGLVEGVELVDLGEHRLRDLDRPVRVWQVGRGRFPALRSLDAFPGNLPLQVSSFVGRERDLDRVAKALDESRVVTLAGVGGVGKTRLALQAAAELVPRFREGAWLVELAPVRDPAGVADAVAAVFDLVPRAGLTTTEVLAEFLRAKELLLLLDNCEHVVEPAAALVEALERSCPHLWVLSTSREGLGTDGERMLAVPPLASPPRGAGLDVLEDAAAVRLFVARAQAVKAEFTLGPDNAEAVAGLCRRLDGVPLAIELAAARIGAMTPAELARRLEHRFEVLAGGRRGAVERHQTLRAAIDWSYDLLTDAQRRLLGRLSVFAGGCTLEAAETVCTGGPVGARDVWELVAALVARSLVVAEDRGGSTRYRLLETIRQYGEDRLSEHGDTDEFARRHAQYYGALFGEVADEPYWLGGDMTFLAEEQDNVLRSMNWAIDHGDVDLALRLYCRVPDAGMQTGLGFSLAPDPVLGLPGAKAHALYPVALARAADQAARQGDLSVAARLADEAEEAGSQLGFPNKGLVDVWASTARASVAMANGSLHEAGELTEHAAAAARRLGLKAATVALSGAAAFYAFAGDADAAIPLAAEALAGARALGIPAVTPRCLSALAAALAKQDPTSARALLEEFLQVRVAARYEAAMDATQATFAAGLLRDPLLVLEIAALAVPGLRWTNIWPQLGGVLNVVAWALTTSNPEAAAVLQGGARRLARSGAREGVPPAASSSIPSAERSNSRTAGVVVELRREAAQHLAATLGDDCLRRLRSDGEATSSDEIARRAIALIDEALRQAEDEDPAPSSTALK